MVVSRSGDEHASCRTKLLQTGGHIDAISEQIPALDDDIAKVDADAKDHPAVSGKVGVAPLKGTLNGNGATHRLHRAGELDHDGIAGHAEDSALVLRHQIGDDFLVKREGPKRAFFIRRHQPAVSGYIGGEDNRKSPIDLR